MRAVTCRGPRDQVVEQVDDPRTADDEAVLRVEAVRVLGGASARPGPGAHVSRRGSVGHRSEAHAGQLSNGAGGAGGAQPWSSSAVGGVNRVRKRS